MIPVLTEDHDWIGDCTVTPSLEVTVRYFLITTFLVSLTIGCADTDEEALIDFDDGKADTWGEGNDDVVVIGESDNGLTFDVVEGQLVVVRLPSTPTSGYDWEVITTDRTFGYPQNTEYDRDSDGDGGIGITMLTWTTSGTMPMIGEHSVILGYKRLSEEGVAPEEYFTFTVNIVAASEEAPSDAVVIDENGLDGTFEVIEGQDIVVRLPTNPSTDYDWYVVSTDRTFGYPTTTEHDVESDSAGGATTTVHIWETDGPMPMTGSHTVTLGLQRSFEDEEADETFTFTVNIVAAPDEEPSDAVVIDENGLDGTFEVVRGQDIVVRLPTNPSTDYDWYVVSTDRTFGYPTTTEHDVESDSAGGATTTVHIWETDGPMPMTGSHTVTLGLQRSFDDEEADETFTFTVEIVAP